MARITVEDCVMVVPNRFELCLIASNRAKNIVSGSSTEYSKSGEKPAVIALREIGDNIVDVEQIRNNIISMIKNGRNSEDENIIDEELTIPEMTVIEENPNQEANFVSENLQVDD